MHLSETTWVLCARCDLMLAFDKDSVLRDILMVLSLPQSRHEVGWPSLKLVASRGSDAFVLASCLVLRSELFQSVFQS